MSDPPQPPRIDRRAALGRVGGVALAAAGFAACGGRPEGKMVPEAPNPPAPMPAVFVPHGGGPWPFVEVSFAAPGAMAGLRRYFEGLAMVPPDKPRALLVVSAHWETAVPTVQTAARPPMLYDYSGFPKAAYHLQWPAPGAPDVAGEVRALLEDAGIAAASDAARGFDHGAFVVTKVGWPEAEIPTFQLSLKRGLDPAEHLAIGQALAPLRRKGVFIIGSGMSYHNMRGFGAAMHGRGQEVLDHSKAFDDWLVESLTRPTSEREQRLIEWARAPHARSCHPREEHLLPLMVVAGTGMEDRVTVPYRDLCMGAHVCAVQVG